MPTILDVDSFHGRTSARARGVNGARDVNGAQRAAPCGTPESEIAGKRRPVTSGARDRADVPTRKGRAPFLPPAAPVQACGVWTTAQRAPDWRQKLPPKPAGVKWVERLIPLLPARLNMDRLASIISRGESVGSQ